MIDPLLSLAFSIHSNRGVYALLLGSGVSRSAGIPTGWEVTLDLIRKLAHLQGENCEPEPAKWYEEKYSEEADYSKLLKRITKTSAERTQLLRSYFEPSEAEREEGIKTPTKAHKAIASLVAKGYIRVILTTNFDRLMERALEEAGVFPTIISTVDSIKGALPITHSTCTLVKLHGDYLDTRVKNTPDELASYPKQLNALLDRIFDEFGLVISGWSGDYDTALCAALLRCRSHRFTTYWTIRDQLREAAHQASRSRRSELIQIRSADSFFSEILEKITAISEYSQPHPLSAKLAVNSLKRYLEDDKKEIRLHDLIMKEAELLNQKMIDYDASSKDDRPTQDKFLARMKYYEASTEILQSMMCCLGYWGKSQNIARNITKILEYLTESQKKPDGYVAWINLRLYPATILLYSVGIAALASENYGVLGAVLLKAKNKYKNSRNQPLALELHAESSIRPDVGQWILGREREYTPASNHLFAILLPTLKEYVPEETQYEHLFDRFEYLLSLICAKFVLENSDTGWTPIGRIGWKHRYEPEQSTIAAFTREISQWSDDIQHPILGWFGSLDKLEKSRSLVNQNIMQLRWR